jgi:hypothetical protein
MASVSETPPDTTRHTPSESASRWPTRLAALLPFALTIVISVGLTLLVQMLLPDRQASSPMLEPTALLNNRLESAATQDPPQRPTSATAAGEPLSESQQLAELRRDMNRLWSAYYLSRAASQIADAEAALRINNLSEAEQVLVTVGISLDQAYDWSAEQEKGPISEFRMQIGRMHAHLYTRPEGMDQRLRLLRQGMLSLVNVEN